MEKNDGKMREKERGNEIQSNLGNNMEDKITYQGGIMDRDFAQMMVGMWIGLARVEKSHVDLIGQCQVVLGHDILEIEKPTWPTTCGRFAYG